MVYKMLRVLNLYLTYHGLGLERQHISKTRGIEQIRRRGCFVCSQGNWVSSNMSQLMTGCVTCHTCHGCVTHFRPILGNIVEVTLVTFPILYIVSHAKGTSFP